MAPRATADATRMALDLHAALHYLVENGGSDLHLKAGNKPKTRIDGSMRSIEEMDVLTPEDFISVVLAALTQLLLGHWHESHTHADEGDGA